MRRRFAELLYEAMKTDDRVFLITADLGFRLWDRIKEDFPNRYANVGAAEQAAVGMAIGLAQEGKIPFVYSITPFLLYRPFELLRTYIDHEGIVVHLVGSGRDNDYERDGFSHWAVDASDILFSLERIQQYYPEDLANLEKVFAGILTSKSPTFLSLSR